MEPASGQDQSGLLKAATVLITAEEFDGPVDAMGFDEYLERADELPESIGSRDDYDDVQRSIGLDKLDPQEIQETWNSFVADEYESESIAEKTGNTSEFTDKAREGNVGSRYGVPTYEFPVECRSCNENPRIDGSMFCPECHPELDEEEVGDEELVTEKYDYDYYLDRVSEQKHENPNRHEVNKSVSGHPEIPVEDTAPEAVEFLERMEREGYDPSQEDDALLYELLGTGTPEWKMSKDAADYKQEPVGNEICANCQFYYEGTDAEGVCSKVRGQVYAEHWCRLWAPGDMLQEKSEQAKRVDKLFGRNEPESKVSQNGDSGVDKFLSGFGGYPKKTRQRGAELGNEHIARLDDAFREQVWPDELQKAPSWSSADDVTSDIKEWVKSVLQMEDPIYDSYDEIPMAAGLTVKEELKDALTEDEGWSINSIEENLRSEFPQMEEFETERIARQEVAGVLNRSKIVSLISRSDDPMVRWVGPKDDDTTELCEDLKSEIGDGVPFSEMMSKLEEYAGDYKMGTPQRVEQGLPHWLCRHTIEVVDE